MAGLRVNIVGAFGLSILQSIGWHSQAAIICKAAIIQFKYRDKLWVIYFTIYSLAQPIRNYTIYCEMPENPRLLSLECGFILTFE